MGHWSNRELASSYHLRATTVGRIHIRNQKIHVGAMTRHQCRASQTQAGH